MKFIAEIETRIDGIPALIGVISFNRVKGSFSYNAPSDLDYHGYTEMEYQILDRKGYKAEWLEKKMSSEDYSRVEEKISEYFN